jgi:transposase-like protein
MDLLKRFMIRITVKLITVMKSRYKCTLFQRNDNYYRQNATEIQATANGQGLYIILMYLTH